MRIGVLGNPRYEELPSLLEKLSQSASELNVELLGEKSVVELFPVPVEELQLPEEHLDLLIIFGGDGTLLRGARALGDPDVPVLGVNVGRVGFLASAGPENFTEYLESFVAGKHAIDVRRTIGGKVKRSKGGEEDDGSWALNDIVIHLSTASRLIGLALRVDGELVGYYSADGLVVATPTGSTAYSLSAGGPIVQPDVDALIVTAISPHTLAVRPLVVSGSSTLEIELVKGAKEDVLVSYDGQMKTKLDQGDGLLVTRREARIRLVRLEGDTYFARVREKLHWGDLTSRTGK